jgi:hypothetical protein
VAAVRWRKAGDEEGFGVSRLPDFPIQTLPRGVAAWRARGVLVGFADLMRRSLPVLGGLLAASLGAPAAAAQTAAAAEADDAVRIESLTPGFRFDYDLATGTASLTNGVRVTYRDTVLTAERVQVDPVTRDVAAEGDVRLERGTQRWAGDRLRYNFTTGAAAAENFTLGSGVIFLRARDLVSTNLPGSTNVSYILRDAFVTTDDVAEPGYRVRARSMMLTGTRVTAEDATVMLGEVPVFWWPRWSKDFRRHEWFNVHYPGYRSRFGAYLLNSLFFPAGPRAQGSVSLDGYADRGVGFGAGLTYDLEPCGAGAARGYYLYDGNPPEDPATGETVAADRFRVRFEHAVTLRTNFTAKVAVRHAGDRYVERDFFESEYRENVQPRTFVEAQQAWRNLTLNVLAAPRLNDFFETVERLPDVRLRAHRLRLGQSPLYYESAQSVACLRRRFAYDVEPEYEAFRADTLQQVLLPHTLFGWLNVTPRAGGRFTYYGETDGRDLDDQTRWVFNTGAEVSAKASRTWAGAESRFWDVQGLRHILEPSLNYAYTPEPDARPLELPQFDRLLPTLRPLPVLFPDYHAIDSVDAQNVLRFGLRNLLQTRRAAGLADLVDWALLMDWRLDPGRGQDDLGDLYSELDFQPRDWLLVTSEVRLDPNRSALRETDTRLTLLPGELWSLGVGHRFLETSDLTGLGNNLVTTRLTWKLSENWALRVSHALELRDGTLEEQYYTVYRDLRSFTGALTLRWRADRGNQPDDFTIGASISLKAFPLFRPGTDAERPERLIGG